MHGSLDYDRSRLQVFDAQYFAIKMPNYENDRC